MPGIIESAGFKPSSRKALFYLVCVPIRLSLVALAFKFHDNPVFKVASFLAAVFSVYTNVDRLASGDAVWWNRAVHVITSSLIASSVVLSVSDLVGYFLLMDIAFGVISSLVIKPW